VVGSAVGSIVSTTDGSIVSTTDGSIARWFYSGAIMAIFIQISMAFIVIRQRNSDSSWYFDDF
jgi:hypothetical protein